jgi:hypothetical protein
MKLTVTSIYGYGWFRDSVRVPGPFEATVERQGEHWTGIADSGEYAGWEVSLSPRHTGPFDGYCNIGLASKDGKEQYGFAMIPLEAINS